MKRSILALSAFLAIAAPQEAEACRLHRYWFYPYPQHCASVTPRAAMRVLPTVAVDPLAPSSADIDRLRTAMVANAKARAWP